MDPSCVNKVGQAVPSTVLSLPTNPIRDPGRPPHGERRVKRRLVYPHSIYSRRKKCPRKTPAPLVGVARLVLPLRNVRPKSVILMLPVSLLPSSSSPVRSCCSPVELSVYPRTFPTRRCQRFLTLPRFARVVTTLMKLT